MDREAGLGVRRDTRSEAPLDSCLPSHGLTNPPTHSPTPWRLQSVKNVLQQCYANPAAVTDELVECILRPGLQAGAVEGGAQGGHCSEVVACLSRQFYNLYAYTLFCVWRCRFAVPAQLTPSPSPTTRPDVSTRTPPLSAVFLDFISYSGGPLPEQQLQVCG